MIYYWLINFDHTVSCLKYILKCAVQFFRYLGFKCVMTLGIGEVSSLNQVRLVLLVSGSRSGHCVIERTRHFNI